MTQSELKNGTVFEFQSEDSWMTCSRQRSLGGSIQFFIVLNSKIVHMSKTFKSFEKKSNQLIRDFNLKQTS